MLSEQIQVRLRDAIHVRLRNPSSSDGELRTVLRDIATEAKARSLRPEEVIISLKSVLGEVALARHGPGPGPDEQRRLQEWLVTTCIRAYFGHD